MLEEKVKSFFANLELKDFEAIRQQCMPGRSGTEIVQQLEQRLADKENVRVKHLKVNEIDGTQLVNVVVELQLTGTFTARKGLDAFPDCPIEFNLGFVHFGDAWLIHRLYLDFDRAIIERQIRAFYDGWSDKDAEAMAQLFPVFPAGSPHENWARENAKEAIRATGHFKIKSIDMQELTIDGRKAMAHISVVQSVKKVSKDEYVEREPVEVNWELLKFGWQWKLVNFETRKPSEP